MSATDVREKLQALQNNPANIRNICILAHVDHGKTTLADSIIASNGIISQRQAGKLRYMDSREDEQQRGITMKSSAISLQYTRGQDKYLVNLIDSPGHVDFSSEVSTAVRLCDGALVIVDAVEGVCPQTHVVLQQAWVEGIKPCLIVNKVDKLITELKFSPTEAYYHLQQILEQVNAITGTLFTSEIFQTAATRTEEEATTVSEREESSEQTEEDIVYDWSAGLEDTDDSSIYFAPEHGNVIFTSALDGWGFGVGHFADLYAKKLGIKVEVLNKTLWGDFFLNTKTKRIYKGAQAKGKKPLFVQFVLDNVWAVYEAVLSKNKDRIDKIVKSMNLKISARDSRHTDTKVHLYAICSQWLPLAKAVLEMTVDHLPSPLQLSRERVERLMSSTARTFESFPTKTALLAEDFLSCSSATAAPTIAFVSKMFVVDSMSVPHHQNRTVSHESRPLTDEEIKQRRELARLRHLAQPTTNQDESSSTISDGALVDGSAADGDKNEDIGSTIFVAFSRLYSGTISRGQKLFVLKPRYDPREVNLDDSCLEEQLPEHVSSFTVGELYILMGREVVPVNQVPAGNVVGIAGLEEHILKSGTVSSSLACPAFRPMSFAAAPILRVAIEPVHASDIPALVRGMKLLNQADPSVEVFVQETGEHVLSTAGEVHLKKCLHDLKKDYAHVALNVSDPIVPFRETVIHPPMVDMVNEAISDENEVKLITNPLSKDTNGENRSNVVTIQTPNKACTLQLQTVPLPEHVTKLLEENSSLLKALSLLNTRTKKEEIQLNEATMTQLKELKEKLHSLFSSLPTDSSFEWQTATERVWSFGPRHTGPNILLNGLKDYQRRSVWSVLESSGTTTRQEQLREYDNSIVNGFQLATLAGPLCEEPMHGVCFILKEWSVTVETAKEVATVEVGETTGENLATTINPTIQTETKNTSQAVVQPSGNSRGPFSGQLISAMKEGCRRALLLQPARLMTAMYTCEILATSDVLGKLYGVLGKRNGKILSEDMKEGSSVFVVQALLPVAESFGFAEELRKKTSGLASPQLVFSHWEVVPYDPFWVPSTEEELLHFGEKADADNVARKYMNGVRKRKGLHVDEKIVEHAEKQRTHKRNK